MGGSIVRRLFRSVSKAPQQVAAPVAPVAAAVSQIEPVAETNARQTLASGGYGSSSIMTSSQGIEEEANVSKTILGGTVKKKK
jgi:hypothetical protein|tara:strand:+ start:37 stop:285 length:249 start_codon:yes stop_codon:yes gene_type:complete